MSDNALVKEASVIEDKTGNQKDLCLSEAIETFKYASRVEGKAKSTIDQYNYVFDNFLDSVKADIKITEITPNAIRRFLQKLMDSKLAKTTVSIHYRVTQTFFNWLVGESLLDKSPLENINPPKTPNKFPRILNQEQTDKLIEAAKNQKNTWAGFRNYTMVICFIDMGLRLSELINAKQYDLDFNERTLKVHGKGAKDRIVFFGFRTYKLLRKWDSIRENKGEPLEDTIFISQNGDRLKHRYVQKIITRLQKKAGLEDTKVSPHVLRHTSATMAVQNNMDAFSLKRFYGWEKIETAMRYVHMNNKAVQKSFLEASPIDNLDSF